MLHLHFFPDNIQWHKSTCVSRMHKITTVWLKNKNIRISIFHTLTHSLSHTHTHTLKHTHTHTHTQSHIHAQRCSIYHNANTLWNAISNHLTFMRKSNRPSALSTYRNLERFTPSSIDENNQCLSHKYVQPLNNSQWCWKKTTFFTVLLSLLCQVENILDTDVLSVKLIVFYALIHNVLAKQINHHHYGNKEALKGIAPWKNSLLSFQ